MKTLHKIILTLSSLLFAISVFAQDAAEVDMADVMRTSGKIYVVVAVLVVIFLSLALYLFFLDRKIGKIESGQNSSK